MIIRAVLAAITMGTVAALTCGCVVHGHPIPAIPDPAALDIGLNSREPLAEPRNDNEGYGRTLESVRMGEAVIDPVEADPALTFALRGGAVPLPTPAKATRVLAKPVRPVLEKYGMLAGFTVGGSDKEPLGERPTVGASRLLSVVLLRFPDAAAAGQAAKEIDAVDAAVSSENVPVTIANHTSAVAHWRPNVPTLAATLAHESFVITMLVGHTTPDLAVLTGLAGKVFDAQVPRLREFQPTPRDKLAALPLDRDRMLARLLAEVPERWPYPTVITTDYDQNAGWHAAVEVTGVVLGPRATYLFGERKKKRSVELDAINGWNDLERFTDVAAARRAFNDQEPADDPEIRSAPAPGGIPDVRCYEQLDVPPQIPLRFSCQIMYGRYLALLRSRDLKSIHQQVAAQLGLLVTSE